MKNVIFNRLPETKSIIRWILFGAVISALALNFTISVAIHMAQNKEIFLMILSPGFTLLIGTMGFMSGIFIIVIKILEVLEIVYDRVVKVELKVK